MEARRQELLNEEDGYWRQRMDQQQLVEKLKAEVAEQEELKGHSEVRAPMVLTPDPVSAVLASDYSLLHALKECPRYTKLTERLCCTHLRQRPCGSHVMLDGCHSAHASLMCKHWHRFIQTHLNSNDTVIIYQYLQMPKMLDLVVSRDCVLIVQMWLYACGPMLAGQADMRKLTDT